MNGIDQSGKILTAASYSEVHQQQAKCPGEDICCICKHKLDCLELQQSSLPSHLTAAKRNGPPRRQYIEEGFPCTSSCIVNKESSKKREKSQAEPEPEPEPVPDVPSESTRCCPSDDKRKTKGKPKKQRSVKKEEESKPSTMCCGGGKGKSKKECSCDKNRPQPVHERLKGDKCVLEFAVLEKHAQNCSKKRPQRPKSKDDRVGPYDVVGRVVYPGCMTLCNVPGRSQANRVGYEDDREDEEQEEVLLPVTSTPESQRVSLQQSRRFSQQLEMTNPSQVQQHNTQAMAAYRVAAGGCSTSSAAMRFRCLDCGMEGPLCANPSCEWSTMVHKPRCPSAINSYKRICDGCVTRVMTAKGLNNSNRSRPANLSAFGAVPQDFDNNCDDDRFDDDNSNGIDNKEQRIERLKNIIEETKSAVKVSKSSKNFPKIADADHGSSDQSISSLN